MDHQIDRGGTPPAPITKYPFGDMQVGDSFVTRADRGPIASAAADYGKRHSKKFSVRKDGERLRVWRIA